MFNITNTLDSYTKQAAIYYYLYMKKYIKEKGLKDAEEGKDKIKNYWQYIDYCFRVLKANQKGCYIYKYGYYSGIDGITMVIRNNETKIFGEMLQQLSEEEKEKRLKKIATTCILSSLENSCNLYWNFGFLHNDRSQRINYIYLQFQDLYYSENFIKVLEGILELQETIKIKIKEWSEKNVYQVEEGCAPGAYKCSA